MTEYAKLVLTVDSTSAKSAGSDIDNLEKSGERAENRFSTLKASAAALGVAVTAAAAAAAALVKNQLDAADAADDAAQAAGTSVEKYTQLAYAMQFGANGAASLDDSMKFLNKSVAGAASGSKEAIAAFNALGIAYLNADGTLRDSADVMIDVADRFAKMEDGAAKSSMAMTLLGRSGSEMIPFLNQGADEINRLRAESDQLGATLSKTSAAAAGQFNDSMVRLKSAAKGFGNQILANLLPALNTLGDEYVASAKNGGKAEAAAQLIAGAFKLVLSAGVGVVATFESIGLELNGLLMASRMALNGNFKGALSVLKEYHNDAVQVAADAMSRIDGIWKAQAQTVAADSQKVGAAVHASMMGSFAGGGGDSKDGEEGKRKAEAEANRQRESANRLAGVQAEIEAEKQARLNGLEVRFADEYTLESMRYQEKLDAYNEYAEAMNIAQEESQAYREQLAIEHGDAMAQIANKSNQGVLNSSLALVGNIAGLFAGHSKKMFKAQKVAAIAQGLLSVKTGIANAMALPFPANIAAAAVVAAKGMSIMSDIRSLNDSGSGGGISAPSISSAGSVSSGASATTPTLATQEQARAQTTDIRLVGIRPDDMITGSYLQKIIEGIGETLADNGGKMGRVELVTA